MHWLTVCMMSSFAICGNLKEGRLFSNKKQGWKDLVTAGPMELFAHSLSTVWNWLVAHQFLMSHTRPPSRFHSNTTIHHHDELFSGAPRATSAISPCADPIHFCSTCMEWCLWAPPSHQEEQVIFCQSNHHGQKAMLNPWHFCVFHFWCSFQQLFQLTLFFAFDLPSGMFLFTSLINESINPIFQGLRCRSLYKYKLPVPVRYYRYCTHKYCTPFCMLYNTTYSSAQRTRAKLDTFTRSLNYSDDINPGQTIFPLFISLLAGWRKELPWE